MRHLAQIGRYKTPGYKSAKSAATLRHEARVMLGFAILFTLAQPGVPMSQETIAEATGMTQQRVCEIEKLALRKLRKDPRLSLTERAKFKCW